MIVSYTTVTVTVTVVSSKCLLTGPKEANDNLDLKLWLRFLFHCNSMK